MQGQQISRVVLPRSGANRFRPMASGVCPSWKNLPYQCHRHRSHCIVRKVQYGGLRSLTPSKAPQNTWHKAPLSPRHPHSVPPPPHPSWLSRSPPRPFEHSVNNMTRSSPVPWAWLRAIMLQTSGWQRRDVVVRQSVPGSRGAPNCAQLLYSSSTTLPPWRRRIGWRRDVVVIRQDPTVPPVSPPAGSVDAMGFTRLLLPLPLPPSAT